MNRWTIFGFQLAGEGAAAQVGEAVAVVPGRVEPAAHGEARATRGDLDPAASLAGSRPVPALVAVHERVHGVLPHLVGPGRAVLAGAEDGLHLVLHGGAGLVDGERRDEPGRLRLAQPDEVGEAAADGGQVALELRHRAGDVVGVEAHPVAAAGLGAQQRGVGGPQHPVAVLGRLGVGRDADGHRHVQVGVTGVEHRHRDPDALGERLGLVQHGERKDHRELLATVAGEVVGLAGAAAQHACDRAQHVVSALVADGVVDRLEVVEVHHQQAEVLAVASGAFDLGLERFVEVAVVVDAGEAVADGLALHLLVRARVLDGDPRQVGEQLDRLEVAAVEQCGLRTGPA